MTLRRNCFWAWIILSWLLIFYAGLAGLLALIAKAVMG